MFMQSTNVPARLNNLRLKTPRGCNKALGRKKRPKQRNHRKSVAQEMHQTKTEFQLVSSPHFVPKRISLKVSPDYGSYTLVMSPSAICIGWTGSHRCDCRYPVVMLLRLYVSGVSRWPAVHLVSLTTLIWNVRAFIISLPSQVTAPLLSHLWRKVYTLWCDGLWGRSIGCDLRVLNRLRVLWTSLLCFAVRSPLSLLRQKGYGWFENEQKLDSSASLLCLTL